MATAIRRAAASAAPVFARYLAGARRSHHSTAAAAASLLSRRTTTRRLFQQTCGSSQCPQRFNFSSVAEKRASDADLVKIIESEIKCAEESDDHNQVEEIPEGFPFEIEDEKGTNIIILRRKYQDEEIEVTVAMPSLVTGEEPDGNRGDGDEDGDNDERPSQSSIPLTVVVSKGTGPSLEFACTAYPDEVVIDSMSVGEEPKPDQEMLAYEGPDFEDLDENLQKAFHKYLELRGITAITTNFLQEYMINKDSREYMHWLNALKQFVEK